MNDMHLCRSGSGHLFEYVTVFRNVDGLEENWKYVKNHKPKSTYSHFIKVTVAEPLYLGIALFALCETVAYGILSGLTWPLKVFCDAPFNFNVNLCQSAVSVYFLCIFSMTFMLSEPNIPTHEGYFPFRENAILTLPRHLRIAHLEQLKSKKKTINVIHKVLEAQKRHNDGLPPIRTPEEEKFHQEIMKVQKYVGLVGDGVKFDGAYYSTLSPEAKDVYEKKVRLRHNLAMDLGLMIEQIKTEGVSSSESTSEDKELLQKLEELKKLIDEYQVKKHLGISRSLFSTLECLCEAQLSYFNGIIIIRLMPSPRR